MAELLICHQSECFGYGLDNRCTRLKAGKGDSLLHYPSQITSTGAGRNTATRWGRGMGKEISAAARGQLLTWPTKIDVGNSNFQSSGLKISSRDLIFTMKHQKSRIIVLLVVNDLMKKDFHGEGRRLPLPSG
jgi:hypothetical protein